MPEGDERKKIDIIYSIINTGTLQVLVQFKLRKLKSAALNVDIKPRERRARSISSVIKLYPSTSVYIAINPS